MEHCACPYLVTRSSVQRLCSDTEPQARFHPSLLTLGPISHLNSLLHGRQARIFPEEYCRDSVGVYSAPPSCLWHTASLSTRPPSPAPAPISRTIYSVALVAAPLPHLDIARLSLAHPTSPLLLDPQDPNTNAPCLGTSPRPCR